MRLKKLSLLLALTLLVSVSALPVTAHAGGSKDTTPPTLTASLEGDALKIESSDDLSGVEAVFVDENRINSLTDGKASVALKDYAGTEKQVSIYAKDYAGNRSDAVKLDNPYYKETLQPLLAAEILPVQITVPDSRKILLRSRKVHLPRKAPERYRTTSVVRMGKNSFTPSLRTRAMSFIW